MNSLTLGLNEPFRALAAKEALLVLRKRWRRVVASGFAGVAVAAIYTFSRPPTYEASTLVEIQAPFSHLDSRSPFQQRTKDETNVGAHIELIQTDRVLNAAAVALDLPSRVEALRMVRPPAPVAADATTLGLAGGPGAAVAGSSFGPAAADSPASVAGSPSARTAASPLTRWLREQIRVEGVHGASMIRITARASTPELARDIANTLSEVYARSDLQMRVESQIRQLSWLNEQLAGIKSQVENGDLALLQYIETANIGLLSGGSGDASEALNPTATNTLTSLEADLSQKELALALARLDLTAKHPRMERLEEEVKILRAQIGHERRRVTEENKKRIRYGMLLRDAELNRELFNLLLKELKEKNLFADDRRSRIEVLEVATLPDARRPISPKPPRDLALGFAAGLLLAIGLTLVQETLDQTVRSEEEVEKLLNLPVLGVVRKISREAQAQVSAKESADRGAIGARTVEAFRSLRTNLIYSRPEDQSRVILVTSTTPQEGKTTVSTNLAMVMAEAGEKVLLIDADLRRPAVHERLNLRRVPGVTNLLIEKVGTASDYTVSVPAHPNLHVLTAGAFAPNPTSLFESARMKELLAHWRTQYDRILIDSPPQLPVADATILGPMVDGVLMVISAGAVEGQRARLSCRQLEAAGAKFFGVVLNQKLSSRMHYEYGYYYYDYDYSYKPKTDGTEPVAAESERRADEGRPA